MSVVGRRRLLISLTSVTVALAAWLALLGILPLQAEPGAPPPTLPNGIAAGDASATSAVLWARSIETGSVTFTVTATVTAAGNAPLVVTASVIEVTRPVTVQVEGLTPATGYAYTVTTPANARMTGQFRTPAAADDRVGLRFGVSGDGRGDLLPFQALVNGPARELDFFLYLGDTVYADVPSPEVPAAAVSLDEFRRKHGEVLSTRLTRNALADLRRATLWYAGMDDHEVRNDYAGGAPASSDSRFEESVGLINDAALYEHGVQAFQEFNPLSAERYAASGVDDRMAGERRFYRFRRFGRDAALLILDARSFRDEPLAPPDFSSQIDLLRFLAETYTPGRTLLGSLQLTQLKADLLVAEQTGVTWKFVALPEPIQNLGVGNAADRYEGYAAERADLLAFIREQNIRNVVFIASDIHGTLVNDLTYLPAFSLTDPQIPTGAFEVTTGPVAYDPPFGPTVVELAAALGLLTPEQVATYQTLPVANDPDDVVDDKDDFVKAAADQLLDALGYSLLGLADSSIDAELIAGDYLAVHTFGWTEFAIDAASQQLMVTTYGIPPYGTQDLADNPAAVLAATPEIVSRFVITPAGASTDAAHRSLYLPIMAR